MKFHENRLKGSRNMERTRKSRVNPLTLTCDLVFSLGSWVICSAHRLTKRNIQVKYQTNRSKGSGGTVSSPNHTFFLGKLEQFVHILSLETDNNLS